jgi:B12-binding domain/radical SAM domain protein
MNTIRFTFLSDRYNRTATAALLSSLEDVDDAINCAARVIESRDAQHVTFEKASETVEVLCMSAMTVTADRAIDLHSRLRRKWGKAAFLSICGGAHPSGDPLCVLEGGFDYACVGEGEDLIIEVASLLAGGRDLNSIKGLYHLENQGLTGKRRSLPVDLDCRRPLPRKMKFPTHIEVGRGCRWGCAYCQTPAIHGGTDRFRSLDAVEEIVSIYADFGMKDFRFVLPNALGYASKEPGVPNCAALDALLDATKARAQGGRIFLGSFPSEVRPDYVTEEAVRIVRKYVSNDRLVIGGQSGSQRILDLVKRGHKVEDIERACDIVTSCGFKPAVDIVFGFPGEKAGDRQASFQLIRNLGKHGNIFNIHFFMPLPGTGLGKSLPVFLTDGERTALDRLAQRGIVRGKWRRQEEFAKRWVERNKSQNPYR